MRQEGFQEEDEEQREGDADINLDTGVDVEGAVPSNCPSSPPSSSLLLRLASPPVLADSAAATAAAADNAAGYKRLFLRRQYSGWVGSQNPKLLNLTEP